MNARLGRFEVDFLWRTHRLVVEADGFTYHSSRPAFVDAPEAVVARIAAALAARP